MAAARDRRVRLRGDHERSGGLSPAPWERPRRSFTRSLRIADDEVVHAELAFEVLRAAGGGEVELGGRALGLELLQELPLASNACLAGVRVFCLGETVAVRLFKRLRDGATIDPARRALDRVLSRRGAPPRLRVVVARMVRGSHGLVEASSALIRSGCRSSSASFAGTTIETTRRSTRPRDPGD